MELVTEGRRLVQIRKIDDIQPITGADFIQLAVVDGWTAIIKKGEFNIGDYCVFFEIDSFVPAADGRFEFLSRSGAKVDETGTERYRIRSMKMKGELSQGLALPVHIFSTEIENTGTEISVLEDTRHGIEQFLNVTKYERPSERNGGTGLGSAKTAGNFPIVIPKTDEDRIQNNFSRLSRTCQGVSFARSLKLDGSSTTVAFFSNPEFYVDKIHDEVKEYNEETGLMDVVETIPYPFQYDDCQLVLCSRNFALKYESDNHFWKAINNDDIMTRLKDYCSQYDRQLAIQGETMGPGIQGNRENFTDYKFFAFRIWDIDNRCFLPYNDFIEVCEQLQITTVPQLGIVKFFDIYNSVKEVLPSADHESINHKIAEGDVYVSTEPVNGVTIHFKVINNKFLLKCED